MKRNERAKELFAAGCHCSQSTLCVFCEELGLPFEDALRISCGFGGGMRHGEVCGVVTGAIMAIGLKYGPKAIDDVERKVKTDGFTVEFNKRFIKKNDTLLCRELLHCDLSVPEGKQYFSDNNLKVKLCYKFIDDGVEILEDILECSKN